MNILEMLLDGVEASKNTIKKAKERVNSSEEKVLFETELNQMERRDADLKRIIISILKKQRKDLFCDPNIVLNSPDDSKNFYQNEITVDSEQAMNICVSTVHQTDTVWQKERRKRMTGSTG